MKSMRCEQCGRPILTSDVQCYHCGAAIPGREAVPVEPDEPGADWRATLRLAAVVLALMVVGLILSSWLGSGL